MPCVRPTQWLRDWLDLRCTLADNCLEVRADEVRWWFMFRELLVPDMDKEDERFAKEQFKPHMPEWLDSYMTSLLAKYRDPTLEPIQRTIAYITHANLVTAHLTAMCKGNQKLIDQMTTLNAQWLKAVDLPTTAP